MILTNLHQHPKVVIFLLTSGFYHKLTSGDLLNDLTNNYVSIEY